MACDPIEQLDAIDWHILKELQENARVSFAELGRIVSLSRPAVAERMRRLEEMGVISGYRAELNLPRLGYCITAFVQISAPGNVVPALSETIRAVPEVLECHRGTGKDYYILKLAASSLEHLEVVLDRLAEYGQVTSSIVLSSVLTNRVVTRVAGLHPA